MLDPASLVPDLSGINITFFSLNLQHASVEDFHYICFQLLYGLLKSYPYTALARTVVLFSLFVIL